MQKVIEYFSLWRFICAVQGVLLSLNSIKNM